MKVFITKNTIITNKINTNLIQYKYWETERNQFTVHLNYPSEIICETVKVEDFDFSEYQDSAELDTDDKRHQYRDVEALAYYLDSRHIRVHKICPAIHNSIMELNVYNKRIIAEQPAS